MYTVLLLTLSIMTFVANVSSAVCLDPDVYLKQRHHILNKEKNMFTGGRVNLTDNEVKVNKMMLTAKYLELSKSYENVSDFLPAQHFFHAKTKIENSTVFSLIKKLPKGASLHTHMLAGVSVDFIIKNFTYRDNLYGCFINGVFKLKFFETPDPANPWKLLKKYREENPQFDSWLRKQLSLEVDNPEEAYKTPKSVWTPFKNIFTTQYDMVCYKPVFKDFIFQLLKELYLDNIVYTELRGTIMPLYDLNNTVYNNEDFFKIFIETVNEFKAKYSSFIGVRYIHSIYRGVTPEVLKSGLDELIQLKKQFPDFIAGFDFVGYEEEGHQIVDYHEILLEARKELNYFFHAGETNWFGHTDLNLVDAVLLNSSRIGHGFSLPKHPILIDIVYQKAIAIELCPISNQVLLLNKDPRNHPLVSFIARGLPVVICNDDPSVWGATGLSYDWYVTFMAMTPKDAGIEVLKEFAMNSVVYSAMSNMERLEFMDEWNKTWQRSIEEILEGHQ